MSKTNKCVLITGASRGIGAAASRAFASKGYVVAGIYKRNEGGIRAVAESIANIGGEMYTYKCDVSDIQDVERTVGYVKEQIGGIDVLVNNAGIYNRVGFLDLEPDQWHETMATNLHGVYYMTRAVVPGMIENSFGRIINVTSVLAFIGSSSGADYAASKAALIGFTRSIARELAEYNITANLIAPGPIDTDIIASDTPEKRAWRERTIPLGRVGKPEEVAEVMVFLASATYITGEVIHVNGGLYMG